jgi:hypothetical protein
MVIGPKLAGAGRVGAGSKHNGRVLVRFLSSHDCILSLQAHVRAQHESDPTPIDDFPG